MLLVPEDDVRHRNVENNNICMFLNNLSRSELNKFRIAEKIVKKKNLP